MTDEQILREFRENLGKAAEHARVALDLLYQKNGPRRSFLFRGALGRAQSILLGLYIQEQHREIHENYGDYHQS